MKKTFDTWSRRQALALAAALAAISTLGAAHAQNPWPGTQPIKLVVPFTAGSGTDIVARLVAEKLGPALGTSVVVDNKPGAGGTLLVHSAGHLVNPWIYKGLSYDTIKDFTGITPMASLPNVLVTGPSHFANVRDLVAKAKANPGGLNYGSAGNGSATHMNAEVFRLAAGLDAQHVPFRGTPEAMTEVMAGRVDWFFAPMVSALPLIKSGKLQALAVGTAKRSPALPEAPTTVEAGVPGSEYLFWVGLFAPAKTPQPVVDRLQAEVAKIMASPELKERLDKLGAEPFTMPSAQFNKFIADETTKAQQVVKAASIKVD
ncbi:tripartite tricarboxylate transporter substrate binding protein [Variovorax paradoxus]|uniref:tripartite tricarboxylate transporter substrate binding protein n=1 Tax=Variovorax paradoxus TaxID=34073 RepID=UPI003ECDBBCE